MIFTISFKQDPEDKEALFSKLKMHSDSENNSDDHVNTNNMFSIEIDNEDISVQTSSTTTTLMTKDKKGISAEKRLKKNESQKLLMRKRRKLENGYQNFKSQDEKRKERNEKARVRMRRKREAKNELRNEMIEKLDEECRTLLRKEKERLR